MSCEFSSAHMHCVLRSESLYSNPVVFQPSFNSNSVCENENPISYPSLTIYHHHSHPQHNNNGHKIELEFVHFFSHPRRSRMCFARAFEWSLSDFFPSLLFSELIHIYLIMDEEMSSDTSEREWGDLLPRFRIISLCEKSWLECAWVCVRRLSGESEVKREFSLFIKKDSHVMTLAMALLFSIPPPEKKVKRSGSADEIFSIRMKCVYFLDIFPFP